MTSALSREFTGTLLVPGDPDYDARRQVHNGLVNKRPAYIAVCHNVSDVMSAVDFARSSGLEVAVRGGGHNVAGRATTDGGVMIDLSPMKAIHVDPRSRRVRAQPGASWGDFNEATQLFGLATTGGVISSTGVAGLTLGGGYGWMMARHGMAHDNLISVQLVTADGTLVIASADENPELFWAVRGGGGNFGIAVWFEFVAHPLATVFAGLVAYPVEHAKDVFCRYRDLSAAASDDLTVFCGFGVLPDGTSIVALPGCHLGAREDAEAELAPFRSITTALVDAYGEISYGSLNAMQDDAFPRGARNYWKSAFLTELTDECIDLIVAASRAMPSSLSTITIEHFHGAATRVDPSATAYPHREPGYNLVLIAQWLDPAEDAVNIARARDTFAALEKFTADASYVNYLDDDDQARVRTAYGSNWERLVSVKRAYDPENLFRLNQNIEP